MAGYLIAETTREEREKIVAESLGNIEANCDGCMAGLAEMYQEYIDGKKELRQINMEFNARYVKSEDMPVRSRCPESFLLIEIKEGTKLKYELRQYEVTE